MIPYDTTGFFIVQKTGIPLSYFEKTSLGKRKISAKKKSVIPSQKLTCSPLKMGWLEDEKILFG